MKRLRLVTAWEPTRMYRPKARQSTTRMFSGGWSSSFSGRSFGIPDGVALIAMQRFSKPEDPTSSCTYHFEPFDQGAEVGVLLVVLDENRLHAFPCALDVHAWPIHLSQIYSFQVSQAPEQDLHEERTK